MKIMIRRWAFPLILLAVTGLGTLIVCSQNLVEHTTVQFSTNATRIDEKAALEYFEKIPGRSARPDAGEAQRIAVKLERHIVEFLDGDPWMPFQQTLGISGYEVYFDHPDEMFYALTQAIPFLSEATAKRVKDFLRRQLTQTPPYAETGFDRRSGRPRESYDVPPSLRRPGMGKANDAFGVYAFWLYCHMTDDKQAAAAHWEAIKTRTQSLVATSYSFNYHQQNSDKGEAQKLNGDLAGLIGLVHLARWHGDPAVEQRARQRGRQLLELRVNLERTNPFILEKSDAASKNLHNARLARYCKLVPEVGEALAKESAGVGGLNLRAFRLERNGWWLAFGDRFIGGENYTNPAHFPRSLFAGAAFLEQLPADQLLTFIDVPWCQGDFYFMATCAEALWISAGRPWTPR